ncbi:MAG: hypothetical protein ACYC5M_01400 [Anaerolineae bacterium]
MSEQIDPNRDRNATPVRQYPEPVGAEPERRLEQDRAPDTIGVYDRPTGLNRFPRSAITLVIVAILVALLAFALFTWVL